MGEELSLLALCDGERALAMAPAQDYKRIFDGDEGPNTGGMGSYSPVPGISPARAEEICALVHQPVVDLLRERGTPFHGVLYAGIMLTADGPKVLEYNVRFGDPGDAGRAAAAALGPARAAARRRRAGRPRRRAAAVGGDWAVTVVLASAGYPASASKGDVIAGLDDVPELVEVTHAGTARRDDGAIVTAGGRVLNVTALGVDGRRRARRRLRGRCRDRLRRAPDAQRHRPARGRVVGSEDGRPRRTVRPSDAAPPAPGARRRSRTARPTRRSAARPRGAARRASARRSARRCRPRRRT